ncbi:MAG: hypothetical protein Q4B29_02260 [Candidatus Saccharibacteria bacterium]|nr:hypothetical protein [Candidatus Saccharibacteria bacterium]
MDKKGEMERQLQYFIKSMDGGWQENILLHDQRIDMELVDAIYKSAQEHKVIELGERK